MLTEKEFISLVKTLISKGYTASESVWHESISYVEYTYTFTFDLMYTREDSPLPKLFCIHDINQS